MPRTRRAYWRAKLDRNMARDTRTTRKLRRDGWGVLVVWECATVPRKRDALRARILRFLERERNRTPV